MSGLLVTTPSKNSSIECIILGAGSGSRLGRGPKAFVKLGNITLLEMAVYTALQINPDRVIVALPESHIEFAKQLIINPKVLFVRGGERRIDTLRILMAKTTSKWIVLHDVVHPFADLKMFSAVLNAARSVGAAAAADQVYDFLYSVNGKQIAKPGQAVIVQKPIAFCRDKIQAGFDKIDSLGISEDLSILEIFNLAGVNPSFIQGSHLNRKITYSADLEFAKAINSKFTCDQVPDDKK